MLLTVAGASSRVAAELLRATARDGMEGLGFRRSDSLELSSAIAEWHGCSARLRIVEWDATRNETFGPALASLDDGLLRHDELAFVYTCGRWWSGDVASIDPESLEELTRIHFLTPAFLLAEISRRLKANKLRRAKLIVVTGLTGEQSSAAFNSLYGATTAAIHHFVRSLAVELAGTEHCAFCIALGLTDKGQPYIHELCSTLVIKKPTSMQEIVDFLRFCISTPCGALNGSVVTLAGGLPDYRDVCRFLSRAEGSHGG
jgi:NAD(P)-dependent dehydrogenase (short-subunit alcohol dehydrogenase family)